MLANIVLVTLALNAVVGLYMHGVRLPKGVVAFHGSFALITFAIWVVYLLQDRPPALAWTALIVVLLVNGLGDAAVVRKWKRKEDGGLGLVGTYLKRVKRPILLAHTAGGGLNLVLILLVALGY
jgi:hypothetical protein